MRERCGNGEAVESVERQKQVSTASHELVNGQAKFPLDRANQAAAKTVRGQPCRLVRPRLSGAPGGKPPDPFHAPHPLRYPIVPPFSSEQIVSEGAGPSRTYFQKPARSLHSLTRKKSWTGTPAPSPKTIPSMRKKGGKKTGGPPRCSVACQNQRKEPYSQHSSRLPLFRLISRWNQNPISGSPRIGIKFRFQAHFWIGKCSGPFG